MPSVVIVLVLGVVAAAAVLAAVVAVVALQRSRRSLEAALGRQLAADTESAALHRRLDELERRLAQSSRHEPQEYVITHLGDGEQLREVAETRVTLTPPAFADAVLRETVVHTASLLHGVRRALAPESRNRIRFEMRREVKRSRKTRKQEVREALREYRARRRAAVATGEPAA